MSIRESKTIRSELLTNIMINLRGVLNNWLLEKLYSSTRDIHTNYEVNRGPISVIR